MACKAALVWAGCSPHFGTGDPGPPPAHRNRYVDLPGVSLICGSHGNNRYVDLPSVILFYGSHGNKHISIRRDASSAAAVLEAIKHIKVCIVFFTDLPGVISIHRDVL